MDFNKMFDQECEENYWDIVNFVSSYLMGTNKEYMPHNRITILGGYEIKEKSIEYFGRFVSKKEN